ncbi:DUF2125 domain-containing protein [Flavimaricola marinus]|uniref:DUF2125 domain-containing protein n=1 Tax=Flavimaricola marinus TaxID=1819565 RepID=A0A238LHG1_9RHOB|nr:DUF2125 domain-containing protein [Flavimaricola marinus]SMY08320.1 hypothetical protein LOM8899_02471 [Flavimaricola marinus]
MTRLLSLLSASTALCWAIPAAAQITAEDVMANSDALYAAYGATRSASTSRDGAVVTVTAESIDWALPMGIGELSVTLSDYTLEENSDGSVSIVYPAGFSARLSGRIPGEGDGSIVMEIGPDAITTLASGDPGAISYSTRTEAVVMTMGEAQVSGAPDIEVNMTLAIDSSETLTRVLEDSLTVVFSESSIGAMTTDFSMQSGDDFSTRSEGRYGPSTSTINMGLIPGGASLLNLGTALRDGMYITGGSTSTGNETFTESFASGNLVDRQTISTGPGEARFSFDQNGISVFGASSNLLANIEQPLVMSPEIGFDVAEFSGGFELPLLADTGAQDFSFQLSLNDLRLGPSIWNLFDPDKALDRSPGDFSIVIEGSAINKVDWLDILSLEGLNFDNELPIDVTSVSLSDLTVAGLGARISGQGAFTFDAGDTVTYPGMPRPTGEAALEASGLNGMIEALADLGLIPTDALFGLRMGLGMVTVPGDGPDTQVSRIELTQDGKIIANGQQLR